MGKKKIKPIKPQLSSESTDEDQIPPSQQHHQEHEEDEDQASSSDTESDSPDPPPPSPPKSKLIDQTPKSDSKPHPSKKRPTSNSEPVNDSKSGKKKRTDAAVSAVADENEDAEANKSGGDSKKLFHRLWSEEDQIAILKGLAEFKSKTGSDPYRHADAFYDFMKESLHAEASSYQLKEKIRRLKKKFETNAQKAESLSKPHDIRVFELSKKVWGNAAGGGGGVVENEKPVKSDPTKEDRAMKVAPPKPKPDLQQELRSVDAEKDVKMSVDEKTDTTSRLMELMRLDKGFGLYGMNEDVVKRGMESIGASDRAELEEEWKELQHAELELHVKRAELIANQARMILEAYNSSNH